MDLSEFFTSLLGSVSGVAILGVAGKYFLETKLQETIRHLEARLDVAAHREKERFTRFHERQVLHLSELYTRISRASRAAERLLPENATATLLEEVKRLLGDAREYAEDHEIYLPDEVAGSAVKIHNALLITSLNFPPIHSSYLPPEIRKDIRHYLDAARAAKEELRITVRAILETGAAPPLGETAAGARAQAP